MLGTADLAYTLISIKEYKLSFQCDLEEGTFLQALYLVICTEIAFKFISLKHIKSPPKCKRVLQVSKLSTRLVHDQGSGFPL